MLLSAILAILPVANAFAPSFAFQTTSPTHAYASHSTISTPATRLNAEPGSFDYALIFDCDGVIIETEELHRLAYNAAFKAAGLEIDGQPVEWSVEYYDVLQNTVGGGKGKMFYHFRNTTGAFPTFLDADVVKPAPATAEEQQALVDDLQAHKTELYKDLIAEKATPRPGVIELMDEALADPNTAVGVCSASTKAAVVSIQCDDMFVIVKFGRIVHACLTSSLSTIYST